VVKLSWNTAEQRSSAFLKAGMEFRDFYAGQRRNAMRENGTYFSTLFHQTAVIVTCHAPAEQWDWRTVTVDYRNLFLPRQLSLEGTGGVSFTLKCIKKHLAARLCLDPLEELTMLPRPSSWETEEREGTDRETNRPRYLVCNNRMHLYM